MICGISIYPGLKCALQDKLCLIEKAAQYGYKKIFTSLQIPETDAAQAAAEWEAVRRLAAACGMDIVADVSPAALRFLHMTKLDFAGLSRRGIKTLRLDYGYSPAQIAAYTKNDAGLSIQLNASTISGEFLQALAEAGADFTHLDGLHNFYPREGTGLDEAFFLSKNALLRSFSIKIGAFLPSFVRPRPPLCAGLPTLEAHRAMPFQLAARHLHALGCDTIFIADELPNEEELNVLSRLRSDDAIHLSLWPYTKNQDVLRLLCGTFSTRLDEARDAFRAQESRALCQNLTIEPEHTADAQPGSVTLDNRNYGRYMGELQIKKRACAADERVNVVGQIPQDELFLLRYLSPGRKFRFILQ